MQNHHTGRLSAIAIGASRRAVELLPAVPRPLFANPVYRLHLDTTGACHNLEALPRSRLHADPLRLHTRPGHISLLATALDHIGAPHADLGHLPQAVLIAGALHEDTGLVTLPTVVASLRSAAWRSLPVRLTHAGASPLHIVLDTFCHAA